MAIQYKTVFSLGMFDLLLNKKPQNIFRVVVTS